ncbi:MAG: hypothetical protein EPO35_11430 [Acidobacteria bacterium]|nr:MAG: hypothetical protein EPO35_11430 [Acidobacteriota bacterium]
MTHHRLVISAIALAAVFALAAPAQADVTAFLGRSTTPAGHAVKGGAVGIGLLVVGFEVEGAIHTEDALKKIPGLKTGMGNVMVQTPTGGAQLYATIGGGLYRETLGTASETSFATNIGGGIKIGLVGPLRLRADYRVLNLRGTPKYATVQRFYVGASLKF